ncbi:MAG: biopolymer transporter ExbD [Acidobacteriota bacterium]|nr:biopolymer transporter ExbD [Acidobacteriota bacterium]
MTKPRINVTPLIDVLLVLLIIFMVVTPMKPSSFKAKIPQEPANVDIKVHPETMVVAIAPDNSLRINLEQNLGTVENPAKAIERLVEVFLMRKINYAAASLDESSVPKTVFIKAPRGINYGSVAKVVDAVKASGANPISLQIDDLD